MKTLVIYKSRTGFTKRYAQWIAEELGCKAEDYKNLGNIDLNSLDLIIFGSRFHASTIDGLKKVRKLVDGKNCKLVVFATGATPAEETKTIEEAMRNNFGDSDIPHFYMQSGLCYEKMSFFDRTLMKMFAKMMSRKKDKSEAEAGMVAAIGKSYDSSDRSYITPLIEYIKKLDAVQ